jgi:integrase
MATIRKRSWTSGGEIKTAWICDYADQEGVRRLKTFKTRKLADAWLVTARHQVASGTHTADSASITIAEAADLWLARCERDDLERSTLAGYKSHVVYHIKPLLGSAKLSRLTAPRVQEFVDQLLAGGRSRALTKKIVGSLSSLISEAQRRGLATQNPVRDVRVRLPKRDQGRPDMPALEELRMLLAEMQDDRWRPLIITLMFTGLRGSEARGLRWPNVDLKAGVLHVRERVDQWGQFGPPKSAAGTREIPLGPFAVNTLKEWRLACPKGELDLAFPNGAGKVESHANILHRGFGPLQVKAGIVSGPKLDREGKPVLDKDDKPVMLPKYGLHSLRHAAAALFIDHGTSPKRLQAIMGHESIQMTFDLYGYLFDLRDDDRAGMQNFGARLLEAS